jgi:excinuclease ABC subunit C
MPILESYVNQYYADSPEIPEEVLLPFALEGREGLADLLSERRGKRVNVLVPSAARNGRSWPWR